MVIIMGFWSWAFWSSWSTLSFLSLHGHCDHYDHHDHQSPCDGNDNQMFRIPRKECDVQYTQSSSLCYKTTQFGQLCYLLYQIWYKYNILQPLRQILLLTVKMWKIYPALTMSYFQWPPSTNIQFQFNPLVKWWPCIENIQNIQFQFNPLVNWWLCGAALPLTPKPSQLPCSRPWLAITGM